ncbi:MAG TPA: sulfurtransferase/chromate resistance protein [Nevskiaceae bacterium]|nr:sulfurtransferase/chromate resistance protein [Nevskiaceae bacterium]
MRGDRTMSPSCHPLRVHELAAHLGAPSWPHVVDVRRESDFLEAGRIIAGSVRRNADCMSYEPGQQVVLVCAHGRSVSQGACTRLSEQGIDARFLEGGYAAWTEAGLPTALWRNPLSTTASHWVTRERPKIDRIACPWLIRRFVDPLAEFLYVPTPDVLRVAKESGATPYDVPDVPFTHRGPLCSFDALVADFDLHAPGLDALATIVRGADTQHPELAPECAGLLAISLGLSKLHADDHAMLAHGMHVYDALYAACRFARGQSHDWRPDALRAEARS